MAPCWTLVAGNQQPLIPTETELQSIYQFVLDYHLQQGSCHISRVVTKPSSSISSLVQLSIGVQAVNINELG